MDDYDLIAYNKLRIDYEYIMSLFQGVVESLSQTAEDFKEADFERDISVLRGIVEEFTKDNPETGEFLQIILDDIVKNREKYIGQDISVLVNQMRYDAIDKEIIQFI